MGGAAQALALGPHAVGEDLAQVDPDHRALGEAEKAHEADQKPNQQPFVMPGEENIRHAGLRQRGADGPD